MKTIKFAKITEILNIMIISFLIFGISACSQKQISTTNSNFNKLMVANDLNHSIKVSYLEFMKTGGEKYDLPIGVQNQSESIIDFPVDYGIKIFIKRSESTDWLEIKDDVTSYPSSEGSNPYLSPKGSDSAKGAFMIHPAITNLDEPATIRVFVEGMIQSDNLNEAHQVVAYVDILLSP